MSLRVLARSLGYSLLSRRAREWIPRAPDGLAVVFSPHFDDETLGAGAAILRLRAAGTPVRIVFMTDGSRSHAAAMDPPELAALRHEEGIRAAGALGVEPSLVTCLGFPETRLESRRAEAVDRVAALLAPLDYRTIMVPSADEPDVWSTDHRVTREVVLAALARLGRRCELLEYLVWFWYHWPWVPVFGSGDTRQLVSLTLRRRFGLDALRAANAFIDVGPVRESKRAALDEHKSQMVRMRSDRPWPILADVGRGEFLGTFLRSREWFRAGVWEQ